MTTGVLEETREQIADSAHKVAEVMRERAGAAKRFVRQGADKAEILYEDTTREIRRHPAASVASTFVVAFGLGFLLGWLSRKK